MLRHSVQYLLHPEVGRHNLILEVLLVVDGFFCFFQFMKQKKWPSFFQSKSVNPVTSAAGGSGTGAKYYLCVI